MNDNRMHELGQNRANQIKMSEICSSTILGIFTLLVIWFSTSLLIRFVS